LSAPLVLSLFPGIGLLDAAFEAEGFCVVRGPDVLWGGDVRRFHPPAGRFDGVIGGPPCQGFSRLLNLLKATGKGRRQIDLVPEFVRCVKEAGPNWYLMENVKGATEPEIAGYRLAVRDVRDSDVGGLTMRLRRFWFGSADGLALDVKPRPQPTLLPPERAVTRNCRMPDERHRARKAGRGGIMPGDGPYMPIEDVCELQGLPRERFRHSPFRREDLRVMLGNGVPLAMGRALARAVKEAIETAEVFA
jgi:DNA (cytosine-5)-methyltransferase 1